MDDSTWTSQAYGDAFTDFTEQTYDLMITVYNALNVLYCMIVCKQNVEAVKQF